MSCIVVEEVVDKMDRSIISGKDPDPVGAMNNIIEALKIDTIARFGNCNIKSTSIVEHDGTNCSDPYITMYILYSYKAMKVIDN